MTALWRWLVSLFARRYPPGTCTLGVVGCTGHYDDRGAPVRSEDA